MTEICYYDILQNEKYGRYLVANKDLDSGELIFTDKAFVIGPKTDTPPLCLGCYCPIVNTLCSKCNWPICSKECESSPHHEPECAIFSKSRVKFQPVEDWTASSTQLDCITPLRMLLAKEKDPDRWQQEVAVMEDHIKERQKRSTWGIDDINVVNFLIDHCKLGEMFDKELVQNICGILEINSVEIPSRGGFSVRALYPRLAVAAHNCVPNITHTILQTDEYQVQVRAAVTIKSGSPINLCYTHVLSPTLVRREFLWESKFFNCECSRCADPTELGTHLSTLKCTKCDNGIILSTNPLDNEASWQCNEKQCGFTTSANAMRKLLAVVQSEVDMLDTLQGSPAIEQREAFIKKYKSVFHPRHSILLSVKHTLAQLYGRVEEYTLEDMPDLLLERKAENCNLLLSTLDVICPGESRMRGMMLYELHAPLMFLAKSEFSAGLITQEALKERLQKPLKCLEESANILQREDPQSPEGIIGIIACQAKQQLVASLEAL